MENNIDIEKIKQWLRDKVPEFAKKVAPVYKILGWKWGGIKDEEGAVPTEQEIADVLQKEIIERVSFDEGHNIMGTGGLYAGFVLIPHGDETTIKLILKMEIEEYKFFDKKDFIKE